VIYLVQNNTNLVISSEGNKPLRFMKLQEFLENSAIVTLKNVVILNVTLRLTGCRKKQRFRGRYVIVPGRCLDRSPAMVLAVISVIPRSLSRQTPLGHHLLSAILHNPTFANYPTIPGHKTRQRTPTAEMWTIFYKNRNLKGKQISSGASMYFS
jgi:hypothetical protein